MQANKSEPDLYPKEVLEIDWWNTSEAKLKEGYKIWSEYYDKWAVGSAEISPGSVAHIRCADAFNAAATEIHGDVDKKNLKVLDFGCGTGLLAQVLKEKFGFHYLVGLDVSEDMIEKARKKSIFNKLICSYLTDKKLSDIENEEFDAAVASQAVTPGQIKPYAFDEILRWIKPGGLVCFTCRSDAYENQEFGYKDKFELLEKEKRWKLISSVKTDYYGDNAPPGHSSTTAVVLTYRILPF